MCTQTRWATVSLALMWLTLGLSSSSIAQTKLYDDFRSKRIDPSKWVGEKASLAPGSDKDRREVSVGIVGEEEDRSLRISQTNYSAITDNNGSSGIGFGLGFAKPSQLKAVSFTLSVDEVQVVDCGSNPSFGTVGFFGDYFNPTGATNGQTGDIVASIGVTRFSRTGGLDVGGSVSQCQDAECDGQTTLSFQDLGPVMAGRTNTLAAIWDQNNHQFIFRLNNNPPIAVPYTVPDSFPPGNADKSFFVFGDVPHCTTKPRPFASITARFGDVYVNP
ncbi:MAG TPA: hypothetical protein VMH04_13775 [Candidatus Solibacter sp.]|nr:hypothetical protein [Candidatus Solibacter sp.]